MLPHTAHLHFHIFPSYLLPIKFPRRDRPQWSEPMIRRRRAGESSPRIIIILSLLLSSLSSSSFSDSLLELDFEGSEKPNKGNNPRKWHCHILVSHRLRDPAYFFLPPLPVL